MWSSPTPTHMHIHTPLPWCLLAAPQRLLAVKGLSEAKADKMLEAARKLTTMGSWITGAEAMHKVGGML
jgi:hypothetical protein